MGLSIGIVGLPNVGKSTLFNALTKAQNAESANYPFCTIEPNTGVVEAFAQRQQQGGSDHDRKAQNRRIFRKFCPRFA